MFDGPMHHCAFECENSLHIYVVIFYNLKPLTVNEKKIIIERRNFIILINISTNHLRWIFTFIVYVIRKVQLY
jgi:hypothetical protein